mgnify:CR=1 FL=1
MTVDVQKLFNEELPGALSRNPDKAKAIGGKYQLNITGSGNWTIDLTASGPSCVAGTTTDAQVTIDVAEPDFQQLVADPSAGMKLFFAGKLKVKGNQMLAMKLKDLFALR